MGALVTAEGLSHRYRRTQALDGISLTLAAGKSAAFIGPDGVGKSTLLALIAGAKRMQEGSLTVFGGDVRTKSMRRELQQRVAYMPQGLGKNLYPELSIRENLEFFGRLYEQGKAEREQRIHHLLEATGLASFIDRPAGKLSGGMKQKLGLCCALIHDPELLILDEPTTGVDPLSRRQFWNLIDSIRAEQKNLTVLVATSYMEEAAQFDTVIMMDAGKILAQGTAAELKAQCGEDDLEKAFIAFLPEEKRRDHVVPNVQKRDLSAQPMAIEAKGLTRRFGAFTAVDHVNFKIPTGEIYGFLGSNGCGKTTTMKMLTGLLPVSEGESSLFGQKLVAGDINNRRRIGYMSQAFSLYGELTVQQNLTLHANLFGLEKEKAAERIAWIYETFDLAAYKNANSGALPLGVRQRLSLAVAVIHAPEILILDEPTSGVDPVARDNFWALLIDLAHQQQVTIFISTHFMNEAARCDRISLMHAGKVIATGTPEELREAKHAATLDDAFVSYLEEALGESSQTQVAVTLESPSTISAKPPKASLFSVARMMAYVRRELLELKRDPIRLGVATLGSSLLMLVFGFGITLDVDSLRYAVLDRDQSPESRLYVEAFAGSSYFKQRPTLASHADLLARMKDGTVSLALEIPPDFGKNLRRSRPTEIAATIDGATPFRAETIGGYVQGIHQRFLKDERLLPTSPLVLESRYRYNQSFESINAIVPSVMGLLLVFIPAILAALSVVREKEMGSIANLYVTPVSRAEFILGKQIPYVLFSMASFTIMFLLAIFVFGIALKGSLLGLVLGALAYVAATTGLGLLVSSFTRSQIAALFGTAILTMMPATQFSGMLRPVATLEGSAYWIGTFYPTTYFLKISVGAFTKGLDFVSLLPFVAHLALFAPVLLALNILTLRKQET
ncbi:MAG: multidrug ABC transporter ATP-binding protein [Azospirillum brasilense]|nr:MAG: multidrug ABC transporter ATP-binding protein [Azospirillum brasilense]